MVRHYCGGLTNKRSKNLAKRWATARGAWSYFPSERTFQSIRSATRKLEQNLWCKYAIHPYIYMEKMPDTRKTTLGRTGAWSKKAKKMI